MPLTIHPVDDGNGCVVRVLTNALLADVGYDIGRYVSLEQLIADGYYDSLLASTQGWHENEHGPWPCCTTSSPGSLRPTIVSQDVVPDGIDWTSDGEGHGGSVEVEAGGNGRRRETVALHVAPADASPRPVSGRGNRHPRPCRAVTGLREFPHRRHPFCLQAIGA